MEQQLLQMKSEHQRIRAVWETPFRKNIPTASHVVRFGYQNKTEATKKKSQSIPGIMPHRKNRK